MREFFVLVLVVLLAGLAAAQDPQHTIRVNVEVKPARKPGLFARMFAREPKPAPVVMVPLQAVPDAAKVAALTALVAGPGVAPPSTQAAPRAAVPTVEVKVNRP